MHKGYRWMIMLLAVVLLVAGCGPEMVTPTPKTQGSEGDTTAIAQEEVATDAPKPESSGESPVDPDDWRALGSADAPVTIVEYSDFQ